ASLLALAAVPSALHAQGTSVDSTPRALSLGAAARLAASQGALALGGQARAEEARARVLQARSAFLPDLTATAGPSVHTVTPAPGLAAELVSMPQRQLRAGVGVGLDVTRAQSQLASTRAQLIAARNERNRASLDLLRALGLPISSRVALSDSLTTLGLATLTT